MGFFENLAGFLKGVVGNNRDNDLEDVLSVKRGLSEAGYYDLTRAPEPHGYITKEMDDGIRRFQQDNGLRVDGYLLPGGETENALRRRTSGALQDRKAHSMAAKPVEYDATGRMIPPGKTQRRA